MVLFFKDGKDDKKHQVHGQLFLFCVSMTLVGTCVIYIALEGVNSVKFLRKRAKERRPSFVKIDSSQESLSDYDSGGAGLLP